MPMLSSRVIRELTQVYQDCKQSSVCHSYASGVPEASTALFGHRMLLERDQVSTDPGKK